MPWFDDPLDELIESLERTLPATPAAQDADDMASMQEDLVALCMFVGALVARPRDPDAVQRAEADRRVQRALANMTRQLTPRPRPS